MGLAVISSHHLFQLCGDRHRPHSHFHHRRVVLLCPCNVAFEHLNGVLYQCRELCAKITVFLNECLNIGLGQQNQIAALPGACIQSMVTQSAPRAAMQQVLEKSRPCFVKDFPHGLPCVDGCCCRRIARMVIQVHPAIRGHVFVDHQRDQPLFGLESCRRIQKCSHLRPGKGAVALLLGCTVQGLCAVKCLLYAVFLFNRKAAQRFLVSIIKIHHDVLLLLWCVSF